MILITDYNEPLTEMTIYKKPWVW